MSDLRDFVKWLDTLEKMPVAGRLHWTEYQNEMRRRSPDNSEEMIRQQFLEQVEKILSENEKKNLHFDGWPVPLNLCGSEPSTSFHYGLHAPISALVNLSKLSFKELDLRGSIIQLTDIWADTLDLSYSGELTLLNCFIGTLRFNDTAVSKLEMSGGAVLNIECPSPSAKVPFSGSVYFDNNVYFPRKPGRRLKNPQPYRNMRAHMLKLENTPMVSRFHTLEQATERKMEGYGFHRGISALYELLSDYGSSALRPFLWFLVLFAVTALVLLSTDGAAIPEAQDLSGWQNSLKGDNWSARAIRAFVLAGQSTLNPLGVFGIKGLLVAKTGLLALWLSFHGLLSAIFVALFIFAIRRRFKMS